MGRAGWKHTEETKAKLKISRARYKTTFSPKARALGKEALRKANLGSVRNVKYGSPEERLYTQWTNGNFKKKGFSLTFEQAKHLMSSQCFYCGGEPAQKIDGGKTKVWSNFRYQGIDRVDSRGIYEDANCVPCCGTCNLMKSDLSQDMFVRQAEKIAMFKKEKDSGVEEHAV
jgi:hypothetical protein